MKKRRSLARARARARERVATPRALTLPDDCCTLIKIAARRRYTAMVTTNVGINQPRGRADNSETSLDTRNHPAPSEKALHFRSESRLLQLTISTKTNVFKFQSTRGTRGKALIVGNVKATIYSITYYWLLLCANSFFHAWSTTCMCIHTRGALIIIDSQAPIFLSRDIA